MPDRVLVTGGNGFIATRLIDSLMSQGTYTIRASTRGDGDRVPPSIEWVPGVDLLTQQHLKDAVVDVDCIVHTAGRVHGMGHMAYTRMELYDRINTDGTLALAREAVKAGTKRFVYISTIAVNGLQTDPKDAFTEVSPPLPNDPYAYSKAAAEIELATLSSETGLEVVIIRPPLVYGPGVKSNFHTMMRWIARGVPLPFGGIEQNRRTLIGLDNLVDLILICLDHTAAANQIFLAGDAEDLSTSSMIRRLAAAMGVKERLIPVPPDIVEWALKSIGQQGIARRLCGSLRVDSSKAQRILGWTPSVSVDRGFRQAAVEFWATKRKSSS